MTAEDGVYRLPDGEYRYTVTAEGFLNASGSFTVSGAALTVSVAMEAGSNVWTGAVSENPPATQTVDGKTWYLITSAEELAWFAGQVNSGNTAIHGKLTTNIVLNSQETPQANRWAGIGSYDKKFAGTFDGNGKVITGYYSNVQGYTSGTGLFAYADANSVIQNVTVEGVIEGDGTVGGIVNQTYGRVENCVNRATITNAGVTGGVVARVYAGGAVVNCGNEGSVTCTLSSSYSDANTGGVVGQSYVPITGCYNTGAVNGGSNNSGKVGGILGSPASGSTASVQITDCYNTGAVTGTTYVGGISGRHTMGTDPTITNCYNAGVVSATGASPVFGAIAGDHLGDIRNCHYLVDSCAQGLGSQREGYTVEITAKTAEEMKNRQFVLELGNASFHLDDGRNGGYPLLHWQGGEHVVNTEAAAAIAAAKEQLTVTPTTVTEPCVLVLATSLEGFAGEIAWTTSDASVIATDGTVVLPAEGAAYVTLTATLTLGGESGSKTFLITVKSLALQDEEMLSAAKTWLDSRATFTPVPGTDVNACTYFENLLAGQGYSGITLAVTDPGAVDYPPETVAHTAGVAADGTITYLNADPTSLTFALDFARVSDVCFTLSRGSRQVQITTKLILGWDPATVETYLRAAVASVTFEDIRGENTAEDSIISDLTLPQRLTAYPYVTLGWKADSDLIVVEGEASAQTLTGRVIRPGTDTQVRLYPVPVFTLNETALETEGFHLTLKAEDLEGIRQEMQRALDDNYLVSKLTYVVGGQTVDPAAVHGDIQLLTPRNTGIEDYDNYRFTVTSDNTDVIEINGYRANVYQPMPGEEPVQVTLTVTMRHKSKDVAVEKQISLTVVPLTQEALDEALELMEAAKAAYWEGINNGANISIYEVTKSLSAFQEVNFAEDGSLSWAYSYKDCLSSGIVPGDQADYSSVGGQEAYNKFKSSNPSVISHENLLLTQPQYHTQVTVESLLEHAVYAKYAEKVTSGPWYDNYFSKLTGQKVSATMTVIGRDGPDPNGDQPPVRTTVTVRLTGVNAVGAVNRTFDTTSDRTVLEAIQEGLGEDYTLTASAYGYVGALTGPEEFNQANASVKYWGQYFYVDGAYDTSSTLDTLVKDGGVYGIFANETSEEEDNYYGYKYNVWLHEGALTVEEGEEFQVTVYQMAGSTAAPWSGVKVYCQDDEIGVSDAGGRVKYCFDQAGTYVLYTGDSNHTYSQCVVTVTATPKPVTVTVRLTGVNAVGAVDRTFETTSDKTVAEAMQLGLGEEYTLTVSSYGYIGSLTGPEDFNQANAAVPYWGQYFYVNGAYDTASPLDTLVEDGGVYGIFANELSKEEISYYGYKYNVWFHETRIQAAAGAEFTAMVYRMDYSAVPAEEIQIFCDGALLGCTDAEGQFAWHFDQAGVYVLSTGDSNHTYSQCVVTVTGQTVEPPCDGGENCPSRTFPDLDPALWYHEGVDYGIRSGLFQGFEDGTFQPDGEMTRAMLVTVLWRLAGSPESDAAHPFTDVPAGVWYEKALSWAYEKGIILGVTATTFAPNESVTREQMATVLFRYAAPSAVQADLSGFADSGRISPYAREAVAWAVSSGLLQGMGGGRLEPLGTATRAQVATVLYRLAEEG